MDLRLEDLTRKRKNYIAAADENNFTEGIRALLTDLYPDNAHFVYELLQNAEDMNATAVRFILTKQGLDFEHNGTKRDFNYDDIEAITSIGHNGQKKNDPTAIGKFGVGFKSVFGYTASPEIHSGQYHFRIEDYFVPVFDGVEHKNCVDTHGVSWTKFYFPFDNPQKPQETAYQEVLKEFLELSENSILFLSHIRRIEYLLPESESNSNIALGYIESHEAADHEFTVRVKLPDKKEEETFQWLRFIKSVSIIDEQNNPKTLNIGIAYRLEKDSTGSRFKIVPIKNGRTFIYFPAEKEYSGLRFNINAPFASTVARDSIRDCPENKKLIIKVAELCQESLVTIKEQGLIDMSFLSVLPHEKDNLGFYYTYIRDYIYNAFANNEYLPTKSYSFTSSVDAIMGSSEISDLFDSNDIKVFFGKAYKWVQNPNQKSSNEDFFIRSLDIKEFGIKEFATLFGADNRYNIERFVCSRSLSALQHFYALCNDTYESTPNIEKNSLRNDFCNSKIVLADNNTFYHAGNIFIMPRGRSIVDQSVPLVNKFFTSDTNKKYKLEAYQFLSDVLKIKTYGPQTICEDILNRISSYSMPHDSYFRDLLQLAEYYINGECDIDVDDKRIFFSDVNTKQVTNRLVLGSPYNDTVWDLVANSTGLQLLSDLYYKKYSENDRRTVIEFAKRLGIFSELSFEATSVFRHPVFYEKLNSDRSMTSKSTERDFSIRELQSLLSAQSFEINRLIWQLLSTVGKNTINSSRYLKARYAPNASAKVKEYDATWLYLLKENEWLPDRDGVFRKPADITVENLDKKFVYNPLNPLHLALNIGSAQNDKVKAIDKLQKDAEKLGYHAISEEDFAAYEEFLKSKEKSRQKIENKGFGELLNSQKKESVPNRNGSDDFSSDGAVPNKKRREEIVEEAFINKSQTAPVVRKAFTVCQKSSTEEKETLRAWYNGYCQMCGSTIEMYNGRNYFVARNIINTKYIPDSLLGTIDLCWNSLCLCPTCSAMYAYCSRDISMLYSQIKNTGIEENNPEPIYITIELNNAPQSIKYVPKHFLALKKAFEIIEKNNSGDT